MAGTKGQRGYLSRLAEPMPAGIDLLKPTPVAGVAGWRELVPEVRETALPGPAAAGSEPPLRRGPEPAPISSRLANPRPMREEPGADLPAKKTIRQSRSMEARTRKQAEADSVPVWSSAAPPQLHADFAGSIVTPQIAIDRRESREPVAQAKPFQAEPIVAPGAPMSATEAKLKPLPVQPAGSSQVAAYAPTAPAAGDRPQQAQVPPPQAKEAAAPHEAAAIQRDEGLSVPEAKTAHAIAELVPAAPAAKQAEGEPKPKERPAARVHIGKLEIRMSAPQQVLLPSQPAPQTREPRTTPIAPTAAREPLARELAWTFGLVQG